MPVDYQSYLLSASPPGFDLNYSIHDHLPRRCDMTKTAIFNPPRVVSVTAPTRRSPFHPCPTYMPAFESSSAVSPREKPKDEKEVVIQREEKSNGKKRKRVWFADDLGGSLVEIRLLTQRPDSPPLFKPEFLSTLTGDSQASVTDLPPFKVNFSQPASDYMAFRKLLDHNCVALENVVIKHYNLMGTVKVKNISFHKKVIVRHTIDSWETFTDVPGVHVPTNSPGVPYDTFSFQVQISPKMDRRRKLEFAVMYEVDGSQYWDNNAGNNFEVVSSDYTDQEITIGSHNTTDRAVFTSAKSDWSVFSGWGNMSSEVPYY